MNATILRLEKNQLPVFKELIRLFEEVFEMKDFTSPPDQHLLQLLSKDTFFVFVAVTESKIIGGLTSYILNQYYSQKPLVYIYDLAVRSEYQRMGIGRMLVEANNNYARSIGAGIVMVQADRVDDHAIKFYQSTGGISEDVIHFDYNL
jgi:aminoglycoside 3-N-acetyltransferase I